MLRLWVIGMVVLVIGLLACSPAAEREEAIERVLENAPVDAGPPVVADRAETLRGVPSRGRDPSVVALRIGENGGLCSGTLISPRLVLTARHCVSKTAKVIECPARGVQVYSDREPSEIAVLVGEDVGAARPVAHGIAIVSPGGVTLCEADIAVLVLDEAVAVAKPAPLRGRGPAAGDRIRAVGFGVGDESEPAGKKLLREHVRVLDVTTSEFTVGEATCHGDSGGPALDEDTGEVIGVVSRGGPECEGPDVHNVYTRVDTYAWLMEEAFARVAEIDLEDRLDAGSTTATLKPAKRGSRSKPASDMGGPCTLGEECAAGICLTDADRSYCSRPCGSGDRCPTRYHCLAAAGLPASERACTQVR